MLKERIEPGSDSRPPEVDGDAQADAVVLDDLDASITPYHLMLFFEKHPGSRFVRVVDVEGTPVGRLMRDVVVRLLPPQALRSTHRGLLQVDHLGGGLTWPQVPRFRCEICGFEDDYPLHNRRQPSPACPLIEEHGPMSRSE